MKKIFLILFLTSFVGFSQTIEVGHLEVFSKDLDGIHSQDRAKDMLQNMGSGWRLPKYTEIKLLYENRDKLEMGGCCYWTSNQDAQGGYGWFFLWDDNGYFPNFGDKGMNQKVRPVRDK